MKGVNYYLNHEKQFCEFLNHGNVPLDNNGKWQIASTLTKF